MISLISLVWTMGGAIVALLVIGAKIYTNMQNDIAKAKGDANAIGGKFGRLISMLAHSSWADTKEKQDQLSKMIEPKW